jgi:hypothetical protein
LKKKAEEDSDSDIEGDAPVVKLEQLLDDMNIGDDNKEEGWEDDEGSDEEEKK